MLKPMRSIDVFGVTLCCAVILGCWSLSGCSKEESNSDSGTADLRTTLEETVTNVRRAILEADRDSFLELVFIQGRPGPGTMTEDQFQGATSNKRTRDRMLDIFPDLERKANFLTLNTVPGWAAYYAELDRGDPDWTSVSVLLFRKNGSVWKACGVVHSHTKGRPGSDAAKKGLATWKGRDEMLQVINAKPEFKVRTLIQQMTEGRAGLSSPLPVSPQPAELRGDLNVFSYGYATTIKVNGIDQGTTTGASSVGTIKGGLKKGKNHIEIVLRKTDDTPQLAPSVKVQLRTGEDTVTEVFTFKPEKKVEGKHTFTFEIAS